MNSAVLALCSLLQLVNRFSNSVNRGQNSKDASRSQQFLSPLQLFLSDDIQQGEFTIAMSVFVSETDITRALYS